ADAQDLRSAGTQLLASGRSVEPELDTLRQLARLSPAPWPLGPRNARALGADVARAARELSQGQGNPLWLARQRWRRGLADGVKEQLGWSFIRVTEFADFSQFG